MGLFNSIFGSKAEREAKAVTEQFFKAFTAYSPVYTSWEGGVYEMELTRSVVGSFATACSKLKPEIKGTAYKNLGKTLQYRPNPFQNTSQFLYRIATILMVNNNAFIVPIEDEYGAITGYFPLLPAGCDVLDIDGVAYLRYTFASGKRAAIELSKVGLLTRFQYQDDFFGADNMPLKATMQVMHTQNQGIVNGIKNSAVIRFLGKIGRTVKDEDLKKAQETFTTANLSAENHNGMLVYDGKFDDVKPIYSKPVNVDPAQMKEIWENVFNYFGTNINILQNSFDEDQWNAYYEGAIAPFALQLSQAMTNMTYTRHELGHGNAMVWGMNNIQYASVSTRMTLSTQFFDRGLMNQHKVADLFGWEHVEGGEKYYIRKEYSQIDKLHEPEHEPADTELMEVVAKAIRKHRKKKGGAEDAKE